MRAIIEEPVDTHRLVFADWLEDDGQSAWAALIRARCAISRYLLPPNNPFCDIASIPASTLTPSLRRQVLACLGELIDRRELDAQTTGPDLLRFQCRIRRGFVELVTIHGGSGLRRFVDEAREVFLRTPLRGLVLEAHVPRPPDSGWGYGSEHDPIDRAAFESLIHLPAFGRLHALDLRALHLNSPWTRLLQRQAPRFAMTSLYVHGWRIGDEARAERLRERFGDQLVIHPAHPGDQATRRCTKTFPSETIMDSHQAFLRAIIEEPDEDTHRLVLADWLDDHYASIGRESFAALLRIPEVARLRYGVQRVGMQGYQIASNDVAGRRVREILGEWLVMREARPESNRTRFHFDSGMFPRRNEWLIADEQEVRLENTT